MRVFLKLTFLQYQNSVRINDSSQSVSHNKDSTCLESISEGFLDEVISLKIYISCCFVKDQNLSLSDDGSC